MYRFNQRYRDRIVAFLIWGWSVSSTTFCIVTGYFDAWVIFLLLLLLPPTIFALTRLFSRHTDFLIDERGITERLHMLQIGYLPWSQIKSVQVLVRDINIILAVEPYDRIEVVSQLTFIHRIFLTWNFKHLRPYLLIALPPQKKGIDPDAIRDALRLHSKYIS